MTRANTFSVLILGEEEDLLLYVARCLSEKADIKIHVLSEKPYTPIRFSRHIVSFHMQPSAQTEEQKLEDILRIIKKTAADLVLPVDSPAIQLVSSHYHKIAEHAACTYVPDPETFEIADNKWLLSRFLKDHDLPQPETICFEKDRIKEEDL